MHLKLFQKKIIQKIAEATGDLIGNKIADEITKISKIRNRIIKKQLQMNMIKKYLKKDICLNDDLRLLRNDLTHKSMKSMKSFIDSCIKSLLNKLHLPKVMVPNVPKRNVFVKLQFLGSTSFQIRKNLQKLFSDKVTSCKLTLTR